MYLWFFCLVILMTITGFTFSLALETMRYDRFWIHKLQEVKQCYSCTSSSLFIDIDRIESQYLASPSNSNIVGIIVLSMFIILVSMAEFWVHIRFLKKWYK